MYRLKLSSLLLSVFISFSVVDMMPRANEWPEGTVALQVIVPTFENVAIKDKTLKITGFASEDTDVELLNGARQLGRSHADRKGHFEIIVPLTLSPGQYQWVLRSTEASGHSATSLQTLVLTIPKKNETHILAMLEEPGKPGRLMFNGLNPIEFNANKTETLAIDHVSFDSDTLTVSGRANSKIVFITVDNKRVAMSKVGSDNRFFVVRPLLLLSGDHIVSVDQIDEDGMITSTERKPFQAKKGSTTSVLSTSLNIGIPLLANPDEKTPDKATHTVVVRKGDTLKKISKRVYGSDRYAGAIFNANRKKLSSMDVIEVGDVLVLPVIEHQ